MLEDILESDATLMPDLKRRPVPDFLCPGLRSSFNPYCEKIEVRSISAGLFTTARDVFSTRSVQYYCLLKSFLSAT